MSDRTRFGVAGHRVLATMFLALTVLPACEIARGRPPAHDRRHAAVRCAPDNGGITLPKGYCATVVAEVPGGRQLLVAPNGDVFVAVAGSPAHPGGVVALRDANGDGRAEVERRFGPNGGTGIALQGGYLYFAPNDAVLRWKLPAGKLEPAGAPDTIVEGLPATGNHVSKTIAVDDHGNLFVDFGSAGNSCQREDRMLESPGIDPCPELEIRAGIWRFSAGKPHQRPGDGARYATGIRNAVAMTLDPRGRVWAAQHGRDQLFQNWPKLYDQKQGAELPAEELLQVNQGDDFGWPYCYYDQLKHRLVLAPEYGGDGVKAGRCESKKGPVYAFPGHWAPDAILYNGSKALPGFGPGLFIAFHGSWNRAPEPQAGYKVVFLPLNGDTPGTPTDFADGFGGPGMATGNARYRPDGLAQGRDGSIYISSDQGGRIWRVIPASRAAH
ncbi:MAG TPA: PQQ-dependent sugar dehydrogenase [Longimicrobiales bacterium]